MSEEDTEEVVLTRWGRMKQWWDIGSTAVKGIKLAMLGFKLLFVGSTAAVVVGQATDTKPLRDVGVEIGMVTEIEPPRAGAVPYIDELLNLQEDVADLEGQILALKDQLMETKLVSGPPGPEGRQGVQGDKGRPGQDGLDGRDGQDGIDGSTTASAEVDRKFDTHVDLLH